MNRRILIAGCGYVGSKLAELCLHRGDEVVAMKRTAGAPQSGLSWISCDLSRPDSCRPLEGPFDAVVYLVGADSHDADAYRRAYEDGVANLCRMVAAAATGRILFASSTGVYAQDNGELVDERSQTQPASFTGLSLLRGESIVRTSGIPSICVRFGGIYGPGRTRFITKILEERPVLDAGSIRYTNRVHRDDAAGIILHLLNLPKAEPVYNGVDDVPCSDLELCRWVAAEAGITLEERPPTDPPVVRGKRCSNLLLRASGYRFLFPDFRAGYRSLLPGSGV